MGENECDTSEISKGGGIDHQGSKVGERSREKKSRMIKKSKVLETK